MFSGSRYFFSTPGQELESGKMVLSNENPFISYRARSRQREFIPANYKLTSAANYETVIRNWQNTNFTYWNQNSSTLQNEDDITAFLAEAVQRGNYTAAVNSVIANANRRRSHRSSVYVGGMGTAYQSFLTSETEKLNLATRLTREKSLAVLREEHIVNYFYTRGYTTLANNIIDILINSDPQRLTIDYVAGLLEVYADLKLWRPDVSIDHLTDQMIQLISDNLNRDTERDFVYVSSSEGANIEYSLRLGKALVYWAQDTANNDWETIGKSIVLSAIEGSNSGRFHNILNPTNFSPRAAWLTDTEHWAWTASPSIRVSYIDGNMNLAFSFPVNLTHYAIIRGVRPFIRIQIHGIDWGTSLEFERYDASGWLYYPQEQILLLKLRHRQAVENVRIIYRAAAPRPTTPAAATTPSEPSGDAVE
jgi:hypothetical protein